jgi:hypothetical protein
MPVPLVVRVEAAAVVAVQPPHAVTEIRLWRFDQQMEMRAHEAVRKAEPSVPQHGGGQPDQIPNPIFVLGEDEPPVDATRSCVVDQPTLLLALLAWHDQEKDARS